MELDIEHGTWSGLDRSDRTGTVSGALAVLDWSGVLGFHTGPDRIRPDLYGISSLGRYWADRGCRNFCVGPPGSARRCQKTVQDRTGGRKLYVVLGDCMLCLRVLYDSMMYGVLLYSLAQELA